EYTHFSIQQTLGFLNTSALGFGDRSDWNNEASVSLSCSRSIKLPRFDMDQWQAEIAAQLARMSNLSVQENQALIDKLLDVNQYWKEYSEQYVSDAKKAFETRNHRIRALEETVRAKAFQITRLEEKLLQVEKSAQLVGSAMLAQDHRFENSQVFVDLQVFVREQNGTVHCLNATIQELLQDKKELQRLVSATGSIVDERDWTIQELRNEITDRNMGCARAEAALEQHQKDSDKIQGDLEVQISHWKSSFDLESSFVSELKRLAFPEQSAIDERDSIIQDLRRECIDLDTQRSKADTMFEEHQEDCRKIQEALRTQVSDVQSAVLHAEALAAKDWELAKTVERLRKQQEAHDKEVETLTAEIRKTKELMDPKGSTVMEAVRGLGALVAEMANR
ncbi:MAG: hypothetical protein LQ341_007198, partial [Variospora aurantia]